MYEALISLQKLDDSNWGSGTIRYVMTETLYLNLQLMQKDSSLFFTESPREVR